MRPPAQAPNIMENAHRLTGAPQRYRGTRASRIPASDDVEEDMAARLIRSDPKIMMGKPVIAGSRIPAELLSEELGAGETVDQLLQAQLD